MATTTGWINFTERGSAPATPAASDWRLYFKAGGLYAVDDAGTEIGPFQTSAGALTQAYAGYNTAGGSWETMTTKRVLAKKITIATDCLITSIGAYLRNNSSGADDQVESLNTALYTDNAGTPQYLIHYGTNLTAASDGPTMLLDSASGATGDGTARWIDQACGVWVAAGDYWIAVAPLDTSTILQIAYDGSGTDRYYTSGGSWFTDWGFYTPTTSSNKYSIRANTIR